MGKYGVVQSMAVLAMYGCLGTGTKREQTLEQYLEARQNGVAMTSQSGFHCNARALSAEERVRHEALTKKLLAKRQETVEMDKGYEFQYSPAEITVQEVAEWVAAESKCCPFFDFHIDLENEGKLVCLRLTGKEGVKQFIRAEFGIQ